MAELGVGYISVIPETSKIAPEISKALNGTQSVADKQGQGIGSKLASGMGKTLKVGAASAGIATGGAIAASLTKGMGRLTAIESAEAKLRGLGNSAGDVSRIMENANAAVTGTAYGLDAAATTAAMAVASGIKPGKELEQVLKTTADTAAIAGASMDEMGAIFGSVAARGKLQGDDLMQLQSRGIPVLEMLSKQVGKTTEDVSKMVSSGTVDFALFERALRDGVGGSALEAGNTFKGAFENAGAAASRVGATALTPFFGLMRTGFDGAKTGLDGLNKALKPLAQDLTGYIDSKVVPAMKSFGSSIGDALSSPQVKNAAALVKVVFNDILNAARALAPVIANVGSTLGKAASQLGGAVWNTFASALSAAASAASALAGPLEVVTGALSKHSGLVTAAVVAWGGFKIVPGIVDKITSSLTGVGGTAKGLHEVGRGVGDMQKYLQATGKESSRFTSAMMVMGSSSNSVLQKMGQAAVNASQPYMQLAVSQRELGTASGTASAAVKQMAGVVAGTGAAAFTGMKSAVGGVVDALGGPWGVAMLAASAGIAVVSDANNRAKSASEQYSKAMAGAAEANRDLSSAVAGTTGALNDQAQEMATKVAESSLAGLSAFQTQVDGFMYKVPPPDMSDFTQRVQEAGDEAFRNMSDDRKYDAMVQKVAKASKDMSKYLEDTGRSMQDLGAIVAAGGPEFDALVEHMRGLGDGGQVVAEELMRSRNELEVTIEAAQRVDPAMAAAAEGIDTLADSASSGDDKLKALHQTLQAMGLAPKDAEQAMMDAAAAVDEIVEAAASANRPVEQLGEALFGMDGKLNPANASARDLASTLNSMRDDLANVAVNGGDVQAAFDGMAPAVSALAQEFGLTEGQVRQLMEAYGVLPDEISTLVNLEGATEATQDVAEVWAALEKMKNEGSTQVEIGAVGDGAKAVLDELKIQWDETVGPDGQKNIVITATDDAAVESVQRVTQMMTELGDKEVDPKVLLDTTQVQVNADQAKSIIDALAIENPSPTARLIIDDLQNNQQVALGDLHFLAEQSATPKATLDKVLLDNGVRDSRSQLDDLGKKTAKPKIDADNSGARRGIQAVRDWLNNIPLVRTIRLVTSRENNAADGLISYGAQRFMAAGGVGKLSQQDAQIAAGGRWITWAEDETQGESFIPHAPAKRKRSTQILAETASIFGLGLVDRGGNEIRRDGTSVAPKSHTFMADGGVTPGQLLRYFQGERVNGQQARRSLQGAPYTFGGYNWGDCSSTQGQGALFAVGRQADNGRFMSTANEASQLASIGFKTGLGSGARYAIGWLNGGPGGGHTSGTIHFADGKSVNVEMGGGAGGQGKIGGAAAGAAHSQYTHRAYLPLSGALSAEMRDELGSDVKSTSVDGVTLKSGTTVSWGKAQELFDQAKKYLSGGSLWPNAARLFDSGGVWKSGQIGVNLSGADEYVFTNAAMKDFRGATGEIRSAATDLRAAVSGAAADGVGQAQRAVLNLGRGFGGDFLGSAEIVQDAEKGLYETRKNISTQAENIGAAEKELTEARGALADAEKNAGVGSEEHKNALERVDKAEEKVRQARESHVDALINLEAAERTVVAARFQAASDLAVAVGDGIGHAFQAISGLFEEFARLADVVDDMRQSVSKLQMQQQTDVLNRIKALSDLQVKTLDLDRVRARGVISVAQAEYELEQARQKATLIGLTSIEAMEGAMDRFYRTGIFSLESMTSEQVENSKEVQEALWNVQIAHKQNALDMLNAAREQEIAQYRVAEATLAQVKSARLLEIQTEHLTKMTAELNGMTRGQATGAAKGFGGIGKVSSGVGKMIGGGLAAAAAFATMGPLGLLLAAPLIASGIADTAKGSIDIRNNKKEIDQAWKSMDHGQRAGIVLGAGLGAAGGIVGGAVGGAEGATAGAKVSEHLVDATIGAYQYDIASKIEVAKRRADDDVERLEREMRLREHKLNMESLDAEIRHIRDKDRAEADLEWAKMMRESVIAPTEKLADAFKEAAAVEAERANRNHFEQMGSLSQQNASLSQIAVTSGQQMDVTKQMLQVLSQMLVAQQGAKSGVSGVGYLARV